MTGTLNPGEIYRQSFSFIKETIGLDNSLKSSIITRVVHATADFEIGKSLVFSASFEDALHYIETGVTAITDINMVLSGISSYPNKKCYIRNADVVTESRNTGISRSYISMRKACLENPESIFIVGDAPTALEALLESVDKGICFPGLIVGVPVGFVSALEVKSRLLGFNGNFITNLSNKGGSAVAAAIFNAMVAYLNVH
ncbi:precorrin-8X methylmutase [Ferroplasma sp.]|uniref:precorrin-8X methylmutase n=1 Tax=Ferroplasma sp. TaxID=2591003 RepID=UPI002611EDAF|nr:precorrin-8X methylmutase [Ferroplasma sp.]